jgi:hypothetical protein
MKELEVQAANAGEIIQEMAVYIIFVQNNSRKRGDTQSRIRWEIRAF